MSSEPGHTECENVEGPSVGADGQRHDRPLGKDPGELDDAAGALPGSDDAGADPGTIGGLTSAEAGRRLLSVGPNAIAEKRRGVAVEVLTFLWGPIPWMIEVADVLSIILRHWEDVIIISVLLAFNAGVGFWQQHTAADAVAALKRQVAPRATVCRDSRWIDVDATDLVPGDLVRIRLGDVVPADVVLVSGDYLRVDQSALTGESLPVDKQPGDTAYAGSVAVQGDVAAEVSDTGPRTLFGRTARLVATTQPVSHFQQAVLSVGKYLIWLTLGLVIVLVAVELARGASALDLLQFALVLTVAAIPVAMPAVLSVTMAVGAMALSQMKAIVTRLDSIEEMAGIDVLCCDKTGTLTENHLALGDPVPIDAGGADEVVLAAALASQPETGDAIDRAILGAAGDPASLAAYRRTRFVPFDPVSKRATAVVSDGGSSFTVTKGAPRAVLDLCDMEEPAAVRAIRAIDDLAGRGYRTLGVARRLGHDPWRFLGLLPLSDPPRPDSAVTIARAADHGLTIKLLTGDDAAIAAEVADRVGLGRDVIRARDLFGDDPGLRLQDPDMASLAAADGFAEVFPEHKHAIVKAFQAHGHLVGMTGDGVNDAPALKQADTGIAVTGATDAARAAADIVLTAPGLSVIVAAVELARRIFERMSSYAIYRIAETIRIVLFVVAAMVVFDFYPMTAILIILLALVNDVPIMAIAVDNTRLDPAPVRWDMPRVLSVATTLGVIGVVETFVLLVLARDWMGLDVAHIETLVFLKLVVAGHLTLFVARTRGPLLKPPWPAPILLSSAVGTDLAATALVAWGFGLVSPISWSQVGFVWGYALAWVFVEDWVKLTLYARLERRPPAPATPSERGCRQREP